MSWEGLISALERWLGAEAPTEVARVAVSALVVYLVALWIVRTGKKRFLGRSSVFDVILGFILGSTLARAINGGAPLLSTAVAGFVLIGLHWFFGVLAHRSSRFGLLVKGGSERIIDRGALDEDAMARHHVTRNDLLEAARLHGLHDLKDVREAHFERSGRISIIPELRARVVSSEVREGVQRLTIEVLV